MSELSNFKISTQDLNQDNPRKNYSRPDSNFKEPKSTSYNKNCDFQPPKIPKSHCKDFPNLRKTQIQNQPSPKNDIINKVHILLPLLLEIPQKDQNPTSSLTYWSETQQPRNRNHAWELFPKKSNKIVLANNLSCEGKPQPKPEQTTAMDNDRWGCTIFSFKSRKSEPWKNFFFFFICWYLCEIAVGFLCWYLYEITSAYDTCDYSVHWSFGFWRFRFSTNSDGTRMDVSTRDLSRFGCALVGWIPILELYYPWCS